jgi:hypothetical protein
MMGCYAQVLVEAAQKKPEGRRKFQIPTTNIQTNYKSQYPENIKL